MKSDGEIMEMLAAYDLLGSTRAAAIAAGCSHHTVANHLAARDGGRALGAGAERERITDPFLPKIEEWIEASKGRIRADKAHAKLLALGHRGSERSTRRAVAAARAAYRLGNVRVHRPWITEPGMWLLCRTLHKSHYEEPAIMQNRTVRSVSRAHWPVLAFPSLST